MKPVALRNGFVAFAILAGLPASIDAQIEYRVQVSGVVFTVPSEKVSRTEWMKQTSDERGTIIDPGQQMMLRELANAAGMTPLAAWSPRTDRNGEISRLVVSSHLNAEKTPILYQPVVCRGLGSVRTYINWFDVRLNEECPNGHAIAVDVTKHATSLEKGQTAILVFSTTLVDAKKKH